MMDNGWISLHRKLIDSPIFKNAHAMQLWIFLLLKANHKDGKCTIGNRTIEVKRGQLLTGRKSLSEATGIHTSKIERLLKMLKTEQQIEQQTSTKYRLISITNYDTYQDSNSKSNNNRTTIEQQTNTNNNVNNDNKKDIEKKTTRFTPPTVNDVDLYIREKGYSFDADKFVSFYETSNWMRGKTKIKNWKACCKTWESNSDKPKQEWGGNVI